MRANLFGESGELFRKFMPTVKQLHVENGVEINEWDLPYTIKQLSYLVHSHYRYYGKFPSTIAGHIIDSCPRTEEADYILDNFSGSGTTLVEAKLRGIPSVGVDISWLSVLASNVKCSHMDLEKVGKMFHSVITSFENSGSDTLIIDDRICSKWFEAKAASDLKKVQKILLNLPRSKESDFLILAFISIVRRVSKAFDGEVRPHINKEKRQRKVLEAFSKKVRDMLNNHHDFLELTNPETETVCHVGNNTNSLPKSAKGNCYLAISHPPYLNSFNYTPVFSLEFYWGAPFETYYSSGDNVSIFKNEMKAHPASEKISEQYFLHLRECYLRTFELQKTGGYLAIVIGDCTRNGKLVPVIDQTKELVEAIGYQLHSINYRTTHYGLGKYAYSSRADYHGKAEKKDGILMFVKG